MTTKSHTAFEHKGITITVTPHGSFEADVDDLHIDAVTLNAVKQKIDLAMRGSSKKKPISLNVVGILARDRYLTDARVFPATIVGLHRSSRKFLFAEKELGSKVRVNYDSILADTDSNRDALENMIETRTTANKAEERVTKAEIEAPGYGRLESIEQYDAAIGRIENAHAKSKKAGG